MCKYKKMDTSSAAKGGGGNFNDRKPIKGKVSCCDVWIPINGILSGICSDTCREANNN